MSKTILAWMLLSYVLRSNGASSFSSTGVPCYMHPSADGCHYRLRPDSNNCSTPAQRESLSKRIAVVNRTLASLEQQLIRLGVIPPDNVCSKLPPVESGGIIYDDLNLAPGATGRYTCYEGYTLVSFDEDGRYEYACTEEGIWDGSVTTVPVKCLLSSERCDLLGDIENGTIAYINNDSSNTLIGDMVMYSCLPGHELTGVSERFCLRTGNWSGDDPMCVQSGEKNNDGLVSGNHKRMDLILGLSIGPAVAVILAVIVAVVLIISMAVYRKRKSKSKMYQRYEERLNDDAGEHYQTFGDKSKSDDTLKETVDNVFGDSFEHTLDPLEGSTGANKAHLVKKPHSGSSKKPSLQLIKDTAVAAAAKGKEKFAAASNRSYRTSRVVMVTDDDEDSL